MSKRIYRYHLTITNNANYPISFIRKKLKIFCRSFKARIIPFEFDKPHNHLHILVEAEKFVDYKKAHRIFGNGLNIKFRRLYMYKDIGDVIEYIMQNIEEMFQAFSQHYESYTAGGCAFISSNYKPTKRDIKRLKESVEKAREERKNREELIKVEEFIKRDIEEIGELLRKISYLCDDMDIDPYNEIRPYIRLMHEITDNMRKGKYSRAELFNQLEDLYNAVYTHYDRLKQEYDKIMVFDDDATDFEIDFTDFIND